MVLVPEVPFCRSSTASSSLVWSWFSTFNIVLRNLLEWLCWWYFSGSPRLWILVGLRNCNEICLAELLNSAFAMLVTDYGFSLAAWLHCHMFERLNFGIGGSVGKSRRWCRGALPRSKLPPNIATEATKFLHGQIHNWWVYSNTTAAKRKSPDAHNKLKLNNYYIKKRNSSRRRRKNILFIMK